MRLGLAHELGLAASCTASLLIVLLGGELPAFAWVTLAAPWLSLALQLAGKQPPASSGTLVGLASVALAVATLVNGGVESSVLAFAELLLGLLCARLLVRRTATHDVQALLVALLLVLAGSVLNVTLSYLWLFITFAVTLVWSLATRQLLAAAPRDLAQERQRGARAGQRSGERARLRFEPVGGGIADQPRDARLQRRHPVEVHGSSGSRSHSSTARIV